MAFRAFPALLVAAVLTAVTAAGWWGANGAITPPDAVLYGAAYQPYRAGQGPAADDPQPSRDQVAQDMDILARTVRSVRTYTALGASAWVPEEAGRRGMSVLLGVWVGPDARRTREEIDAAVRLARNPAVKGIVIGNEALLRGDATVDRIQQIAREVRIRTGRPVTTAEPWGTWAENPRLAEDLDFITIHMLPYWENTTTATAVADAKERILRIKDMHPGKRIVVGETGWPSGGKQWWDKTTGVLEEAAFVRGIFSWLEEQRIDGYIMEAFDGVWKYSIEGSPGAYWGLWDDSRTHQKFPLTGPVERLPRWWVFALGAAAAGGALTLAASRRSRDGLRGLVVVACGAFALGNGLAALAGLTDATYFTPGGAAAWAGLLVLLAGTVLVLCGDVTELAGILGRPPRPLASPRPTRFPVVSIHIPTHREPPEMVIETIRSLSCLEWPEYEVIVIDNNTPEEDLWRPVAAECAALNARLGRPVFRFLHRMGVRGFKGGALNIALAETRPDAEAIAVVDADYVLDPDWLRRTVPHLEDHRVGFVQVPQDHRDGRATAFKAWIAQEYDGFFHIGMVERDKDNSPIMHGTMCLIRRAALQSIGGWQSRSITEDAETGLRLHAAGWRSVYLPLSCGRGLMPDDWAAYAMQRYRWAYGGMRILIEHRGLVFGASRLDPAQRWRYVSGWLPWIGDSLGLVFALLSVLWTALYLLLPDTVELPPRALFTASVAAFLLRLAYGFVLHRLRVPCGLAASLRAAVAGAALAPTIGWAMLHAAIAPGMPFKRTPKATGRSRVLPALRSVRVEMALATALAAAAATMLAQWWDPDAVFWGAALAIQALPPAAAVLLALVGAAPRWPRRLSRRRARRRQEAAA